MEAIKNAMSGTTDLNDTITVKVKGVSIVFRRMLDKLNELENKNRIISGDCYIDVYEPNVVWRSRGKKHLKFICMLTVEETNAVKAFIHKVLPAVEKKVEEKPPEKLWDPEPEPSKATGICAGMVKGAIVKCPEYSGCWDGPFLRTDNKCGHKTSARPRSEPTPAPGHPEQAKPS